MLDEQRSKDDLISELKQLRKQNSDLQRSIQTLSENAERLNALMDFNPSLIFLKDEDGRYVYLNKTYETEFVGSSDWYGKSDFDFWPKESAELFRKNDSDVLESGQVHQFLEDSTDMKGNRYCWLNYKFPFIDSRNRRYLGGIGIDATPRILTEEALQKAGEELQRYADELKRKEEESLEMIDSFTEGSWIVDCVAGTIKCSEKWAKRIGLDRVPEEERLSYAHTLSHPDDTAGGNSIPYCIETGVARFDLEYRINTVDCGYIWTQNRGKIVYDEQGKAVKVYAATNDITERKRAEKELEDHKLHLEELVKKRNCEVEEAVRQKLDILESISDCFYSLDRELSFTYINKGAEDAWGISRDELLGKKIEDIFPDSIDTSLLKFRQVLKERIVQHYELFSNVTKSWVYMSVYPTTPDGISVFWHDITELKEAQLQLQRSRQDISDILISIKDPFFTLDREWRFSYVNQAAREQFSHFGILAGHNIWERFPKMVGSIFWDKYHEAMNSKKPLCFEAMTEYTGFWSQVSVYPLAEGISVLFSDISDRKEAEEALRQSEKELGMERQRLYDVLETLPVNICLLTADFDIPFTNRAFREKYGEPNGRTCYDYICSLDKPCENCGAIGVFETRQPHHCYFSGPDGSTAEIYHLPFIDVDGTPLVLEMNVDITERKQAEDALRLSEERFKTLFHASPVLASIIDLDTEVFLDVNETWLRVVGYEREEIIGKCSFNYDNNQANMNRRLKLREASLLTDKGYIEEGVMYTKNGEKRICIFSFVKIELEGRSCLLNQIVDVTREKSMEADLARLDRLNLIGEMAASIGHEIRNPMTAVRGFLQMLGSQDAYENDRDYFDIMIDELDRANIIISEYLGMAKNKKIELRMQPLDDVVRSLHPMIQADANFMEIAVNVDLADPPMPLIDSNEIRQLILNIARNGLEAMSPGGLLTIGSTFEENEIVLFIKDQGTGLSDELKDKIGTPFLTTKEKGTGLGLAVCYSIAARHKARIDFETGPEGTTFFVRFPKPEEQELKLI